MPGILSRKLFNRQRSCSGAGRSWESQSSQKHFGPWKILKGAFYFPTRACAHCYWRLHSLPSVEDEWHVLLICPLYESIRRGMPFTADELCVEGHPHQGAGCTNRNLQSLVGAILRTERFQFIIDYLIRASKIRRQHRKPPTPHRAPLRVTQ